MQREISTTRDSVEHMYLHTFTDILDTEKFMYACYKCTKILQHARGTQNQNFLHEANSWPKIAIEIIWHNSWSSMTNIHWDMPLLRQNFRPQIFLLGHSFWAILHHFQHLKLAKVPPPPRENLPYVVIITTYIHLRHTGHISTNIGPTLSGVVPNDFYSYFGSRIGLV